MKYFVLVEFECSRRQSACAHEQQACCCTVLTAGKSHTWNTLSATRDLSHALPTLTNSILSVSCGVHTFTVTVTHSVTIPTTDCQTVNFHSTCVVHK